MKQNRGKKGGKKVKNNNNNSIQDGNNMKDSSPITSPQQDSPMITSPQQDSPMITSPQQDSPMITSPPTINTSSSPEPDLPRESNSPSSSSSEPDPSREPHTSSSPEVRRSSEESQPNPISTTNTKEEEEEVVAAASVKENTKAEERVNISPPSPPITTTNNNNDDELPPNLPSIDRIDTTPDKSLDFQFPEFEVTMTTPGLNPNQLDQGDQDKAVMMGEGSPQPMEVDPVSSNRESEEPVSKVGVEPDSVISSNKETRPDSIPTSKVAPEPTSPPTSTRPSPIKPTSTPLSPMDSPAHLPPIKPTSTPFSPMDSPAHHHPPTDPTRTEVSSDGSVEDFVCDMEVEDIDSTTNELNLFSLAPPLAPEMLTKFELIDGALTLEVKPGIALGSFYLGQSFNAVVANLNYNSMLIPTVDFSHDPKSPLSKDYALQLRNNGLVLYFDSSLQVLKEVVVHDLSRVRISYKGIICSSVDKKLTSARVHQLLGPTYPGHFNQARDQYILDYPGLSFYFHVPAQSTEHQLVQEAPLENPGTSAPVCHRICVYINRPHAVSSVLTSVMGSDQSESGFLSSVLSKYISRVKILPTVGICFLPRLGERPKHATWVLLGKTTAQEVMADLGPPGKVFYKDDNKMDIHKIQSGGAPTPNHHHHQTTRPHSIPIPSPASSPSSQNSYPSSMEDRHPILPPTDYFYNYFEHGVDILFDGTTHRAKKLILHTNFPSHFDFNVYRKCYFEFITPSRNGAPATLPDNQLSAWPPASTAITSDSLLPTIQEAWGAPIGRPVVYDRSYGDYHNPFHPTTLQGYPGNLILEVLENNHLASVTLF